LFDSLVSCHKEQKTIARIHILLPFALTVPKKEQYPINEDVADGYRIRIYPPEKSEKVDSPTDVEDIKINGVSAFNADVLRVDFQKDNFNRTESIELDPPAELIKSVANDFLARLRYVANASKVKSIEFPNVNWNIRYLNDDETELAEEKGFVRGKSGRKFQYSFVALNKEVWEDVHSISPGQNLPVWKTLLLDAHSVLPEIGPAIILTFTALEVFISKTLDDIAATSEISNELWKWINNRGYLKDPSIEEKYDFLSRHLIGFSIKDDDHLWEPFKHLRKARNSFAHNGIPMIGDEPVTEDKARFFIRKANDIIESFKNNLPDVLKWPEFKHDIKMEFYQKFDKSETKDN
jgi:hypothetical protein